ncbi:hypothetical protein MTR_7g098850 [Medicago truncatula]|uniref:DUF7086 domain-containing protein n=1 Tax=Medicago truncatula TaxID=3880 RepID=G7KYG7_MEDTR|nr:hypothetical protein MTR_7g098850 [Medicago truncatula]
MQQVDYKKCYESDNKKENDQLVVLAQLGQMIGCCKLKHYKYVCKYPDNHRTGAEDRLNYLMSTCANNSKQIWSC